MLGTLHFAQPTKLFRTTVIDKTTSHPTKQPQDGCQVVGYPAQAGIQLKHSTSRKA
jgi:hypothetical protein